MTHSSSIRRWLCPIVCLLGVVLTAPATHAAGSDDAQALADKMLDRLGGRDAWAGLRNTVNGSQQNRAGEPTVVYAVITMDFERPRFRIDTTAPDIRLIRVVDGENSWRLNLAGELEALPADRYEGEMRWYGAHVYRTIHRVAAREPGLSLLLAVDAPCLDQALEALVVVAGLQALGGGPGLRLDVVAAGPRRAPPVLQVLVAGSLARPHGGPVDGHLETLAELHLRALAAPARDHLSRNVPPQHRDELRHGPQVVSVRSPGRLATRESTPASSP